MLLPEFISEKFSLKHPSTTTIPGAITKVKVAGTDVPVLFVALTSVVYVPGAIGVPEMIPVVVFKLNPAGNVFPLTIE